MEASTTIPWAVTHVPQNTTARYALPLDTRRSVAQVCRLSSAIKHGSIESVLAPILFNLSTVVSTTIACATQRS